MNTYANILNKMLASQIQQYLKVITHCDQMGFILEMQRWFNIHKPWIHYIITIKNESICDWCTKSILQDSTAVYEEKTKQNKKPLSKIGTEGIYLNIIKAICGKSRANIRHSGEKLKAIPVKLFFIFLDTSQERRYNRKAAKTPQRRTVRRELSKGDY